MTFNPASRDERMAACASRACALSVSFTCAPVSVPPHGMLSRMDFHCSLVRSLASWAACLTPSRNFSSNASSSLSPFFTLDSSKLAPPSVSFCSATLVGFDDLEQGIIHPRERVREGFFHIDLAVSNANVNAFSDLAHNAIDLLQAQFAHLQRLKRDVANGGPYLFVLLYRLGSHRLEHLVRIDRWGFHLISPAYSRVPMFTP